MGKSRLFYRGFQDSVTVAKCPTRDSRPLWFDKVEQVSVPKQTDHCSDE